MQNNFGSFICGMYDYRIGLFNGRQMCKQT